MPVFSKSLTRTVYFLDSPIEIETYQEKHSPHAQQHVGRGYPLNPTLRIHFDQTPNDDREAQEVEDWWDLPFVLTQTWDEREQHTRAHQGRLRAEKSEHAVSDAELEAMIERQKQSWFKEYPEGTQYSVRCLDGGAWDRSTFWGSFATLDEALACCDAGPVWRR